jgi:hypothetical protein
MLGLRLVLVFDDTLITLREKKKKKTDTDTVSSALVSVS